ncbi:major facilitator superfamily protein, partial [Striga asiatica]
MEKDFGLRHLFMTVFLYCFANLMVVPAITDVTLAALCPGKDECSLAIYISGAQQALIGLGSLVVMPLVGNLSDTYGRKVLLTVPMTLSVFPLVILAYSRTKYYFYSYYMLRTLISMASEGSVQFLALAYVADNVPEGKRAAVFGILSGFASSSFVFGNFSARFLSTSATFEVAAAISIIALLYMREFFPESNGICTKTSEIDRLLEKAPLSQKQLRINGSEKHQGPIKSEPLASNDDGKADPQGFSPKWDALFSEHGEFGDGSGSEIRSSKKEQETDCSFDAIGNGNSTVSDFPGGIRCGRRPAALATIGTLSRKRRMFVSYISLGGTTSADRFGVTCGNAFGWEFIGHLWKKSVAHCPHDSFVILAYNRTKYYFYAYYMLRTLISMASEGSVQFLALAYVADNVPDGKRAAVFGIMSGFASSSFVFGNFSARFLSTSATFQVAAAISVIALLYMRIFLPESNGICTKTSETDRLLEKGPSKKSSLFKTLSSVNDTICLLRTSPTFLKAAVVAFFINAADVGLYASLMMLLHSIAWAPWVPYVASMITVISTFALPCLRSIASKQTGPSEQGKAQGCITGICSFSNIVSPLAFSPLTALFLSDHAPFHFPGFSIMVSGLAAMIAFVQSLMIRPTPSRVDNCSNISTSGQIEPLIDQRNNMKATTKLSKTIAHIVDAMSHHRACHDKHALAKEPHLRSKFQ